jgi:hypothetical protein
MGIPEIYTGLYAAAAPIKRKGRRNIMYLGSMGIL